MFGLNCPARVSPSDAFPWPLGLEGGPVLVQQIGQTGHQRRNPHDGCAPHPLVVIDAQQVFVVLKERFDAPAHRQDVDDRLGIRVHHGAAPVADFRQRLVEAEACDHHQRRTQLADPGRYRVDEHLMPPLLRCPVGLNPVGGCQRSGVLIQPQIGFRLVAPRTHPPILLPPAADAPPAVARSSAHPITMIPCIGQEVRVRSGHRFELLDRAHRQVHLALEGHAFPFADFFLGVQPWRQGTAAPEQDVQAGEQIRSTLCC